MSDLVIPILVGLFLLGKWVMQNAGSSAEDQPGSPLAPDADPQQTFKPISAKAQSDEERLRRFMQALGLPPESLPPQPVAPPPLAQEQSSKPPELPRIAPSISSEMDRPWRKAREIQDRQTRKQSSQSPARQRPRREERPRMSPELDQGRIAPELEPIAPIAALAKTQSVSETADQMEVATIPRINFGTPVQDAESAVNSAGRVERTGFETTKPCFLAVSVLPMLRDPASLRKALILREIIGPPKALQSSRTPFIFALP